MTWSKRLRIAAWFALFAGLGCLPVGFGVSPKRDLSFFNNLADLGMFLWLAGALVGVSLVLFATSYFVGQHED